MSINNARGRMRKELFSTKQDLIGKKLYDGNINRSYETLPRFKVTDKKGMSWTISSDKPLEVLLAMDKYKGCTIIPIV